MRWERWIQGENVEFGWILKYVLGDALNVETCSVCASRMTISTFAFSCRSASSPILFLPCGVLFCSAVGSTTPCGFTVFHSFFSGCSFPPRCRNSASTLQAGQLAQSSDPMAAAMCAFCFLSLEFRSQYDEGKLKDLALQQYRRKCQNMDLRSAFFFWK